MVPGYIASTLLAPRALFDRVGGFDTKLWFGDGADWFMRAAETGAVVVLLKARTFLERNQPCRS